MFSTSTQRKHWMHESPEELDDLRKDANKSAKKAVLKANDIKPDQLLSPKDEQYLIRSYLVYLKEFCRKFAPKSVIATAFVYMKRFYLNESCMKYHPRNIGVTCAYLACKIDEFNVSIDQFIKNVNGDHTKAQITVLSNELLLMKKLRFHLTVHLPYRPVSGFIIDIKARYPPAKDKIDLLAPEIDDYLDKAMFTDACFLYTPSQIALAAIYHSAQKSNLDLSNYLSDILFANQADALEYFRLAADKIGNLIANDLQSSPGKEVIKKIEKSLLQMM